MNSRLSHRSSKHTLSAEGIAINRNCVAKETWPLNKLNTMILFLVVGSYMTCLPKRSVPVWLDWPFTYLTTKVLLTIHFLFLFPRSFCFERTLQTSRLRGWWMKEGSISRLVDSRSVYQCTRYQLLLLLLPLRSIKKVIDVLTNQLHHMFVPTPTDWHWPWQIQSDWPNNPFELLSRLSARLRVLDASTLTCLLLANVYVREIKHRRNDRARLKYFTARHLFPGCWRGG